MISEICPKSFQRYLSLPILGSILDEFIKWSYQQGYKISTIRNQLKDALHIDRFLRQNGAECLSDLTRSSFEVAWSFYHHLRPAIAGTTRQIEKFIDETRGLEDLPPRPMTPTILELDRFAEYLQNVRGLKNTTINSHIRYLNSFLKHICYDSNTEALTNLTLGKIEGFINIHAKRLNRYSLQHVIGYLRAFLRFQHGQGVLDRALHKMIDTPRVYRLEQLPRSLPWEMVEGLLQSIDQTNSHGIRDHAMLFLASNYGLRACEIVSLTLDDIDWRTGLLKVPRCKRGNQLILPLTEDAGEVLVNYLQKSRPKLYYRELFLRVRAPHGPLKPTAINDAFQLRVRLSGLDIPYQGTHCLRHSYAINLLRKGTSVKTIGDLLGHKSAESTCVYLRLDLEDLRSVALPVPEELCINAPINILPPSHRSRDIDLSKTANSDKKVSHSLGSFLADEIKTYIQLKRSLGRAYGNETNTLNSLDTFLSNQYHASKELTAQMFNHWCKTLVHFSPTVRRSRMRIVRNFCLYRSRLDPSLFIPDPLTFPANNQPLSPYIFSKLDIARILSATKYLNSTSRCPLRSQTMRIAIILLYTTGIRRGELLRLNLGDYNKAQGTLLINATKFYKSRIIPLSSSTILELDSYLELRCKSSLPMEGKSPLIWNGYGGSNGRSYSGTGLGATLATLCLSLNIIARNGKPPRIHDLRHSFAINVLDKLYDAGEDIGAKLPSLSTYMGHVSIVTTHYYLSFIEGIRLKASMRFQQNFGSDITAALDSTNIGG